jgi:acyl carrier protein
MNGIGRPRNNEGARAKPAVNHSGGGGPSGKAVSNVNAAKSNTAPNRPMSIPHGGVSEVVRRMLIARSIDGTVTADADLREIGLTSLDMVDLVLSVESEFDLQIPEAQITPANFRSISAIDALVNALRG